MGRLDEAERLLGRVEGTANHLGLFSEEYDLEWKDCLGNFPQAFAHLGYIRSVTALLAQQQKTFEKPSGKRLSFLKRLLSTKILLNDGEPDQEMTAADLAFELKQCMNILRGAFFDTAEGRVAYERMGRSNVYEQYLNLSYALKCVNLHDLETRDERIAFWIDLYNVMVIHGVIELGIRDSVKEVTNFFGRISYQVGEHCFTPDDIEHGILRGNRRPPGRLFKKFARDDPRLWFSVDPVDPRIHFALVCASSSCPPIDVYTPEHLDEELDISGRTFLNAGGVQMERNRNRVYLSRTFKWYGVDFGNARPAILRFIAPYLYRDENRSYLEKNADRLSIKYQSYDWRLNRS